MAFIDFLMLWYDVANCWWVTGQSAFEQDADSMSLLDPLHVLLR